MLGLAGCRWLTEPGDESSLLSSWILDFDLASEFWAGAEDRVVWPEIEKGLWRG